MEFLKGTFASHFSRTFANIANRIIRAVHHPYTWSRIPFKLHLRNKQSREKDAKQTNGFIFSFAHRRRTCVPIKTIRRVEEDSLRTFEKKRASLPLSKGKWLAGVI